MLNPPPFPPLLRNLLENVCFLRLFLWISFRLFLWFYIFVVGMRDEQSSSPVVWKTHAIKNVNWPTCFPFIAKSGWKMHQNRLKMSCFILKLAWNMSCFILKLAYIWWFQVGWGSLFLKIIEHIFKSRLVWGRVLVEDIFNLHLILVEDIFKESSDQTCNKYFFYKRSANFNRIKNCYCLIDEGVNINFIWI